MKIAGKRFGRLLVIRQITERELRKIGKKPGTYWLVRCDCGAEKIRRGISFTHTVTASCGCGKYTHTNHFMKFGEAAKNRAYYRTKKSMQASRRARGKNAHNWTLTFSQFIKLSSQPCVYCGIPWSREISPRTGSSVYGFYRFNGIDRINSSKGYIRGNCAPCCKWCNYAKRDMPISEFKKWLIRTYTYFIKNRPKHFVLPVLRA